MADIVLTIPNNQLSRVVDALCIAGGYTGSLADQASRREFARTVVGDLVRQTVLRVERNEAATRAMADVIVDPITVE